MKMFKKMRIRYMACAMTLMYLLSTGVSAAGLAESTLGVGLKNLINDFGLFAVVLCPIVGGAAAVVFAMRRSMADEADGKMWTKRIQIAIMCGVGGMLVSGVITLISGYFV